MTQRTRLGGVCDRCGTRVKQLVDDMYHANQTPGIDQPFDSIVMRAECSWRVPVSESTRS